MFYNALAVPAIAAVPFRSYAIRSCSSPQGIDQKGSNAAGTIMQELSVRL
jgi:hypothetical protein